MRLRPRSAIAGWATAFGAQLCLPGKNVQTGCGADMPLPSPRSQMITGVITVCSFITWLSIPILLRCLPGKRCRQVGVINSFHYCLQYHWCWHFAATGAGPCHPCGILIVGLLHRRGHSIATVYCRHNPVNSVNNHTIVLGV